MNKGGSEWHKMEEASSSKTQKPVYRTTQGLSLPWELQISNLVSWSSRFESRHGHQLSWLHFSLFFLVSKYVDFVATATFQILSDSSTSMIYGPNYSSVIIQAEVSPTRLWRHDRNWLFLCRYNPACIMLWLTEKNQLAPRDMTQ
jgi:hypothetical protein